MKKYYENAEDNAAFDRCIDVMAHLIQKYGPAIIEKRETGDRSLRTAALPDGQSGKSLTQIKESA